MTEHARKLHELISRTTTGWNPAAAAYQLIADAPEAEQPELFHRFLLEYKYADTAGTTPPAVYFSGRDADLYSESCTRLLNQWMEELQAEQLTEDSFHRALWQRICALSNETLRTMMMAACGGDSRLPYISPARTRLVDGYTTETFAAAVKQMDAVPVHMVQHILQQDYERVTQDAAALLPLLDEYTTQEEKALLLSMMFLAVHEKMQLADFRSMLKQAADDAMDELIRETMEEYDE